MTRKSELTVSDGRGRLGGTDFSRGKTLGRRAHELIPGGAHTYAKGDDQFPELAPPFIVRGEGCHVWDMDGNEFIEYGMGLRSVTLGHALPPVIDAVARQLRVRDEFHSACADRGRVCGAVPRDGPDRRNGQVLQGRLDGARWRGEACARAYTGRDMIAICGDHPFFSTSDWFIGTTDMPGGVPALDPAAHRQVQLQRPRIGRALFASHPGEIACVILEAARTIEPEPGFLRELQALCRQQGALLVFDEMITGFRWHASGAQHVYGVTPDLSAFGKAMANGFALSALAGLPGCHAPWRLRPRS